MKENPRLYEINAARWLFGLSEKYGKRLTLGTVPKTEWDGIAGFDCVWLMGVWKRSKAAIRIFQNEAEYGSFARLFDFVLPGWKEADLIGSPYSISAYSPDPMFGDWDDLKKARHELERRNMGLILDFVPNHTAPDHSWVDTNPEYYMPGSEDDYRKEPGLFTLLKNRDGGPLYLRRGKDPFFPPWTDTLQLNHFNPDMRKALVGELEKIARHADGFRCDMAMLVLNDIFEKTWGFTGFSFASRDEFWDGARAAVPGKTLIAEAYWDTERRLRELGFDYTYDKTLYDRIRGGDPGHVRSHLTEEPGFQRKLVRFIENHDEPRSASVFGPDKLRAAAVLLLTLPGMKLLHEGQFEGLKIKIPLQLRRVMDEEADTDLRDFYLHLLSITAHEAYSRGDWELKEVSPAYDDTAGNIIAYTWRAPGAMKLVSVNFSPRRSQGRIRLKKEEIPGIKECALYDELSGQSYERDGAEMAEAGLHVIIDGFKAHIFDIPRGPRRIMLLRK